MEKTGKQIATQYGVIYGVISVLFAVLQYALGMFTLGGEQNIAMSIIGILIAIAVPLMALLAIRKNQGGFLNFKEGFRRAFTVTFIGTLFSAVWIALYTLVLEPGYQDIMLEKVYEQMQEQGTPEEAMKMGMEWTKKTTGPLGMILTTLFSGILLGALIALILSAILKKDGGETA